MHLSCTQYAILMKYLIISDIHGSETTLLRALSRFEQWKCDYLVVLGDILNYGPRNPLPEGLNPLKVAALLNEHADHILAVRGNCDAEIDQMLLDFPCMADYAQILDEGKRIFLTHGHIYNPERMPKGHFDLFLSGHTHLWNLYRNEHTTFCNTGSITRPKNENPPTLACYESGVIRVFDLNSGALLAEQTL